MRWPVMGVIIGIAAAAVLVLAAITIGGGPVPAVDPAGNTTEFISLPDHFRAEIYSDTVPGARSLARGRNGTIFVGTRDKGKVYALAGDAGSTRATRQWTIAEGLFMPNGVAFRNGSLFVAEVNRTLRYDDIENRLDNPPEPVVLPISLPSETHHGWKFIRFGPDGKLYIPVGMPCNICNPPDERFGTILRVNPDGSNLEIYASGIRNTVGFDWDPVTGDLWFTDNGRDYLGDNLPPDELNHAPVAGLNFGFPWYYGSCIENPEYAGTTHPTTCVPPALELPAHVAPLGMRFYTGSLFPPEYHKGVFIAEHGSWNRKDPIGYQVVFVRFENGKPLPAVPFATGFLGPGGKVYGRPVDVEVLPDGSLLVSDDYAGRIYRITYNA